MSAVMRRFAIPLLVSLAAFAQDPRGTIGGRVVDRSGAVVVGAKVQIRNVQTGVTSVVRTNDTGAFLAPFLLPGNYNLTAERLQDLLAGEFTIAGRRHFRFDHSSGYWSPQPRR